MSDHTAFFYGTLMAAPVLHRVIWGSPSPPTPAHASLLSIRPALLSSHQRHKVKSADYPAILPSSATSSVRGTLVTGLTDGDIWRLDIFEGSEYTRRKVMVKVLNQDDGEGEEVEAETYIWVAGAHRLEEQEWDFDEFVKEKMGRWVGGDEMGEGADEGFQDVENAVAALHEDPTGGRGANGKISRQLQEGGKKEDKILESAI